MRHGKQEARSNSKHAGLTSGEAKRLVEKYGYNEIKAKKKNPLLLFVRKFYGPVQVLLWIVAIISLITGKPADFYIIMALLIFNAVVGFLEEYRADKSVETLSSMLASTARALRDGEWKVLPARMLVPGDVIRIRLGDIIPADAKVLECELLEMDESVISGESFLAEKKEGDRVYQGSVAKRGEATCIVTGTGYDTKYGMTEKLVQVAEPRSHLEGAILGIVKYLVAADSVIVLIMLLYGTLVVGLSISILLPFLLVILVASVPVALSAAFTASMALGTEKMAKESVLVTRLEAIEDTSTMEILCTDKTGTLTQNAITLKEIIPYWSDEKTVLKYAAEASRQEDNDPIDTAVLSYASALHIKTGRQLSFSPFNPSTKRTQAAIGDGRKYEVTKGAAWAVMKLVQLSPEQRKKINATVNNLADRGLRSLAVAMRNGAGAWKMMGIVALYDPPRPEAKHLMGELNELGISVKMITGDSLPVAKEIAGEVGLGKNILMLGGKSKGSDKRIITAEGFAGVYPEDKYRIVKALQSAGYVVGMTGDGVNDAPALKEAEVGIAVANATDVAKSSAALVLTKNGLEVIVDAVKESRRIFARMITYTLVKVAKVFQIVGFVAITFIALKFMPITPFLLILLIFTNDIVNIAISTDNADYSGKPDSWNIKPIMKISGVIGILLMVEALAFVPLGLYVLGLSIVQFQTFAFLIFNVTDQFAVFSLREKRHFWRSRPSTKLILSSVLGIAIGVSLSYFGIFVASIGIVPIVLIFVLGAAFMLINDFVKVAALKRFMVYR
ncbi:plasma-membrane proton-efflux P-type ATPase [Candidatus Marsarchaeota archaeon]|nr:plasma-membrane proton-efflux P-type ATPase [Candidatus Marsarchaeota archaeon]